MSYQMCCRILTLLNDNANAHSNLNFMVSAAETYSLITTGLAREYFVQYNPIDYVIPVVHPDPSYSFRFSIPNVTGTAYVTSGLATALPTSANATCDTSIVGGFLSLSFGKRGSGLDSGSGWGEEMFFIGC